MELKLGSKNPETAATILDEMEGIARARFVVSAGRPYVPLGTERLETADHTMVIDTYAFVGGFKIDLQRTTLKADGSLVWLSATTTTEDAYIALRDAVVECCVKEGLPAPRLFETEDEEDEEE